MSTLILRRIWRNSQSLYVVFRFEKRESIIFLEYQTSKILEELRKSLYQEHLSHLKETDDDAPYIHGKFWYFCKTIEGQSYKIYCRRERLKEDDRLMKNEIAGVCHFSY